MRILHISRKSTAPKFQHPGFQQELCSVGEAAFLENGAEMTLEAVLDRVRATDVFLTGHGALPLPVELAADPGNLRYVCNLTGTVRSLVPMELFEAGVLVSNWGDAPAFSLGESALALLLAVLKDFPLRMRTVRDGMWGNAEGFRQGSLRGLTLGLYGYGFAARELHELLRPFRVNLKVYDPFVEEIPEDARRVDSLRALFEGSHAVSIHAGLTDATRKSVTRELLALLPDGGVIVNNARGDILDQDALFEALESGRLRAGLDVLADKDWLPPEHPARDWPNLLLTCHKVSANSWPPDRKEMNSMHRVCLENLRRFRDGKAPRFLLNGDRIHLST